MNYVLGQAGLELIMSFEGYRDGVYDDSRKFATCGYGHLLHTSPATHADHERYDGRGRAFFLDLLRKDVDHDAMGPMNRLIHATLNEHQVDALASLAFNCGSGALEGIVGKRVNEQRYKEAADDFLLWAHPSELRSRREQERALFLKPAQPEVKLPWLEPDERRWVGEYDHLRAHHLDPERQQVLIAVMTGRRKAIWHAAQGKGGWEVHNRRQRYHSLRVRTDPT